MSQKMSLPLSQSREPLFSVSIKDCEVQTFRSGGKGGQNQNKVESGVRILHRPSGAVGESREHREQLQNKRAAFRRLAQSKMFTAWALQKARELEGYKTIERIVDDLMAPENIKTEILVDQKWVEVNEEYFKDKK